MMTLTFRLFICVMVASGAALTLAQDRAGSADRHMGKQMMASEHSVHDLSPCSPDGVALSGVDVASYWDETLSERPLVGSEAITVEHEQLTYRFVSEANRDRFTADPDAFLPSYRGWCSTNLAMGRLACPDVTNFEIQGGRLLLFEQIGFSNGRDVWNLDADGHRLAADINFRQLLEQG